MSNLRTIEVPVEGMTCTGCTESARNAISSLNGVVSVQVYLGTEKAVIQLDPARTNLTAICEAAENVGFRIPTGAAPQSASPKLAGFTRQILVLLGIVFGVVLFVAVAGEWLGLFETVTEKIPWPAGLAAVLVAGSPIFFKVVRGAFHREITSHTLMTVGAVAALAVGEWTAAAIVVLFMHVGDYVERFTTSRARRAVKDLTAMAPPTALVERDGEEQEVPISEVQTGETVIVRPGEKIPVDGEVAGGQATVDQAAITGESMPVEVGPGARVYAATMVRLGSLRIRASHVGADTTFGRVVRMVEEAEAHRADVQRIGDRFSTYFLPFVIGIAALTFLLSRDPLATAAVLVVACSCAFAIATPVAMLASIGAGAKRGLLIKGGKYLELLARADVLLIDKTGTVTLGRPRISDIVPLNGAAEEDVLALSATAERYSEHPLAEAVRDEARHRAVPLGEPEGFEAIPGLGVQAWSDGHLVTVGNRRMIRTAPDLTKIGELEAQGKSMLFVARDGTPIGALAAADTMRSEVPAALAAVRELGIRHIELLTGDNERAATSLAESLGVKYRANLLPEDKIAVVKEYQAKGHTVVMVGDGVNDAPALAQADVGIAMGTAGTDVAIEAGHMALMRDDWALVPEAFRIARRTMMVIKVNIAFTAVFNLVGLSLAAVGILPIILAAAAQSLPDIGILANSSRLLRQR